MNFACAQFFVVKQNKCKMATVEQYCFEPVILCYASSPWTSSKLKNQTHHKHMKPPKLLRRSSECVESCKRRKLGTSKMVVRAKKRTLLQERELACKVSGMRRLKVHFIVAWESLLFRCKDSCNSDKIHTFGSKFTSFFGRSQPT